MTRVQLLLLYYYYYSRVPRPRFFPPSSGTASLLLLLMMMRHSLCAGTLSQGDRPLGLEGGFMDFPSFRTSYSHVRSLFLSRPVSLRVSAWRSAARVSAVLYRLLAT